MQRLLIIGAGGFGRSVAEAAIASGSYALTGFADDRWPDLPPIWGYPILAKASDLRPLEGRVDAAIVAIGDNTRRREIFAEAMRIGLHMANVIHPRAYVAPTAQLARGIAVMAGAVVGCEARVNDGALVNSGAIVDHHAEVGAFAHLGIGACLPAGSCLAPRAWLQAACTLQPGQCTEEGAVIGRDTTARG